jgi:hypothetical protein
MDLDLSTSVDHLQLRIADEYLIAQKQAGMSYIPTFVTHSLSQNPAAPLSVCVTLGKTVFLWTPSKLLHL